MRTGAKWFSCALPYLHKNTAKTVVSPDVRAGADHDTLFPIQAALGYSIAQTLFMGKKCVVVEGITDYWLMKSLDAVLATRAPGTGLDAEIVLVPAGGTSRLMPLASLMFGAAGMHGKNMLVLLDTDKEGQYRAPLVRGFERVPANVASIHEVPQSCSLSPASNSPGATGLRA